MPNEYIYVLSAVMIGALFFYFFSDLKGVVISWSGFILVILTVAFLSNNVVVTGLVVLFTMTILNIKKPIDKIALFFLLFPLLPTEFLLIVPFPQAEQFFTLTYHRALSLVILLPLVLYFMTFAKKRVFSFKFDKFIILYFVCTWVLNFRNGTFTGALRVAMHNFIDFVIPYFAITRTLENEEGFKKIIKPMIFTGFILVIIVAIEFFKKWSLFDVFTGAFGGMERGGYYRAKASFSHGVQFGIFMNLMIALLFYIKDEIFGKRKNFYLALTIFVLGLLFTVSIGPVLGLVIFFLIFALLLRGRAIKLFAPILVLILAMFATPIGKTIWDAMLFVEENETFRISSFEYRKVLLENSIKVIMLSPLTGNINFQDESEIVDLRKYGGAILGGTASDIVNVYLGIALQYGLIGLGTFLLFIFSIMVNLLRSVTVFKENNLLGKILFAATGSFLFSISTSNFGSFVGRYGWSLFSLCCAYIYAVKKGGFVKQAPAVLKNMKQY